MKNVKKIFSVVILMTVLFCLAGSLTSCGGKAKNFVIESSAGGGTITMPSTYKTSASGKATVKGNSFVSNGDYTYIRTGSNYRFTAGSNTVVGNFNSDYTVFTFELV